MKVNHSEDSITVRSFKDILQKVDSTLLPAIKLHRSSTDFLAKKDELDFLAVKNSLLLSYLMDLTYHFSQALQSKSGSIERLTEMRTALEKVRPLEKKMRYQLDKLLSLNVNSASFAIVGSQEDPLSYRPNPSSLKGEEEEDGQNGEDINNDSRIEDVASNDKDLAHVKQTLELSRVKEGKLDIPSDVYRAPRMAAVPYPSNGLSTMDKEKRVNKKIRTTELAHTLKEMYTDAPEQEDMHGGVDFGKQRDASRRLMEIEREKTRFEEDNMIRLTTSRKHKKERKKLMREESSNLSAISDIRSLSRSVSTAFDTKSQTSISKNGSTDEMATRKEKRSDRGPSNPLQKELFGMRDPSKRKKSKRY
jgi:Sas10/Utp3/C1D family